jgi:hypothetical protein
MSLALALVAMFAAAPPAETPRAFVERLYAGYRNPDYSPFAKPGRIFAPSLVAAIREDARLSRGEVGYLDGDPICQCQDAAGMRHSIEDLRQESGTRAIARVRLAFADSDFRALELRLVRAGPGWRIADVATAGEPSLLESLRRSNRRRAGRKQ